MENPNQKSAEELQLLDNYLTSAITDLYKKLTEFKEFFFKDKIQLNYANKIQALEIRFTEIIKETNTPIMDQAGLSYYLAICIDYIKELKNATPSSNFQLLYYELVEPLYTTFSIFIDKIKPSNANMHESTDQIDNSGPNSDILSAIEELPEEFILKMLSYLNESDLKNMQRVNKNFQRLSLDTTLNIASFLKPLEENMQNKETIVSLLRNLRKYYRLFENRGKEGDVEAYAIHILSSNNIENIDIKMLEKCIKKLDSKEYPKILDSLLITNLVLTNKEFNLDKKHTKEEDLTKFCIKLIKAYHYIFTLYVNLSGIHLDNIDIHFLTTSGLLSTPGIRLDNAELKFSLKPEQLDLNFILNIEGAKLENQTIYFPNIEIANLKNVSFIDSEVILVSISNGSEVIKLFKGNSYGNLYLANFFLDDQTINVEILAGILSDIQRAALSAFKKDIDRQTTFPSNYNLFRKCQAAPFCLLRNGIYAKAPDDPILGSTYYYNGSSSQSIYREALTYLKQKAEQIGINNDQEQQWFKEIEQALFQISTDLAAHNQSMELDEDISESDQSIELDEYTFESDQSIEPDEDTFKSALFDSQNFKDQTLDFNALSKINLKNANFFGATIQVNEGDLSRLTELFTKEPSSNWYLATFSFTFVPNKSNFESFHILAIKTIEKHIYEQPNFAVLYDLFNKLKASNMGLFRVKIRDYIDNKISHNKDTPTYKHVLVELGQKACNMEIQNLQELQWLTEIKDELIRCTPKPTSKWSTKFTDTKIIEKIEIALANAKEKFPESKNELQC